MIYSAENLGTALRHLIELLDGAVEASYQAEGLTWRARYTPITRALILSGPVSMRELSLQAGVSHSAVSQTVAQMVKDGFAQLRAGRDGRERIVALSPEAEAMLPRLQILWRAVTEASVQLDAELSAPLSVAVHQAIAVLSREPFENRIHSLAREMTRDLAPGE